MKFTIDLSKFTEVSGVISRSIDTKDFQSEVVIGINTEKKEFRMSTRSQSCYFDGSVLIENLEDCQKNVEWSVEPSQFKTIIGILPNTGEIIFEMDNDSRVFHISFGDSKINLAVAEVPSFQRETNLIRLGTVSASEFTNNLNNMVKLCSNNPVHFEHPLSCLHLFIDKEITMMSTNGASLAEIKQNIEDNEEKFECLLKPNQVATLLIGNFKGDDIIPIIKTETMIGYVDSVGVLCLVSRTTFPPLDYKQILGKTAKKEYFECSSENFKYATETLGKLAFTGSDLKFILKDGSIVVFNENEDKIKLQVTGDFENTEIRIAKTPLYQLSKFLKGNFRVYWEGNSGQRFLRFILIENEVEKEDVFLVITTND